MSVNYFCKLVKKDNSEILASIDVGWQIRDYMVSHEELIQPFDDESLKDIPETIITESERENRLFLGWTDAESFFASTIDSFKKELEADKQKLRSLEDRCLLAKTRVAYDKIMDDISYVKDCLECNEDNIEAFKWLEFAVNYELRERRCYRNNKVIELDEVYTYRDLKDYDLYFFWS